MVKTLAVQRFGRNIDVDKALHEYRKTRLSLVVILADNRDKLGLPDLPIELLRDDLRLGPNAAGTRIRFLLVLAVTQDKNLQDVRVDDHRFHEYILVLTRLEVPLVEYRINAMVAQRGRKVQDELLVLCIRPAVGNKNFRVFSSRVHLGVDLVLLDG